MCRIESERSPNVLSSPSFSSAHDERSSLCLSCFCKKDPFLIPSDSFPALEGWNPVFPIFGDYSPPLFPMSCGVVPNCDGTIWPILSSGELRSPAFDGHTHSRNSKTFSLSSMNEFGDSFLVLTFWKLRLPCFPPLCPATPLPFC